MLVGGLGTRLRPLTDRLPKPMLPVAGVPLVVHQIARAREAGVDHVVLATSYRADILADALGDGTRLGVRIDYAVEDEPLGTGGAIRNAATHLRSGPEGAVLVFNGDVIDGHDIRARVAAHVGAGADATRETFRGLLDRVPADLGGDVVIVEDVAVEDQHRLVGGGGEGWGSVADRPAGAQRLVLDRVIDAHTSLLPSPSSSAKTSAR